MALPWSPNLVSGLALWMDASDSASITQSSGAVSQWLDKSGRNNTFSQATVSSRPSYITAAYNRLNCIRFQNDDFFSFPRPHGTIGSTFVVYFTTDSQYLHYNSDTNVSHSIAVNSAESGITSFSGGLGGDGGIFYDGKAASWANRSVAWNQLNTGAVRVLEHTQMSLASTTATMEWNGYDTNWSMVGDICEIVFTEGYVSASVRQLLEGYFAHKWGFASSLASDHPYKSAAPLAASIKGTIKDKNNQSAIRKIYAIDETTDELISTSYSLADGSFNIPFATTTPKTLVISGEANRNSLVYNGLVPN